MPARKKVSKTAKNTSANLGFEANLWLAADKLRNNMDAADWNEMIETVLEDSLQGKWGCSPIRPHLLRGRLPWPMGVGLPFKTVTSCPTGEDKAEAAEST